MQHDILNTEVTTIDGEKTTLAAYAGKVLISSSLPGSWPRNWLQGKPRTLNPCGANSSCSANGEHRAPLYQKLIAAAPKAVAPEGSGFYERMASKGRAPLYG
jgi:glutathione peroxidase